jgi:hypothetical protein
VLQHRSPRAVSSRKGQHHHLSQSARHALELLDVAPHGLTEPLLLTYGFSRKMLSGLVRSELATTQRQTVKVSGEPVEVTCVRITAAGHQALVHEGDKPPEPEAPKAASRKPGRMASA